MKKTINATSEFGLVVEKLVSEQNMTYMDALLYIMEKDNIDPEALSKLVKRSSVIKLKLELESEQLNLLKSEKREVLPL